MSRNILVLVDENGIVLLVVVALSSQLWSQILRKEKEKVTNIVDELSTISNVCPFFQRVKDKNKTAGGEERMCLA